MTATVNRLLRLLRFDALELFIIMKFYVLVACKAVAQRKMSNRIVPKTNPMNYSAVDSTTEITLIFDGATADNQLNKLSSNKLKWIHGQKQDDTFKQTKQHENTLYAFFFFFNSLSQSVGWRWPMLTPDDGCVLAGTKLSKIGKHRKS